MASQPPPGDNVREMYMELLRVTSQLMALINQNPEEAMSILRAFPELARAFCRAMSMLLNVGLPPYLPVEVDDQPVAAYSPLLPQPPLGPPARPAPRAPPQVQPPSAAAAESVFDAGNVQGESSSSPEEELPPPPSQTPPKSTRGGKK
ncbi:formin-like protein 16 [Dioscorea cayenensis subsp. rotundata]|uniref:Formin-like protein 16 n=1 Tax=Dioscorea cayennensis subsp. rotundata TaxID=55577 RepID=A0AB40CTS1_DIOCR|nr:formin-like protein 16 [Dioscorea cayenensis subsp. rotundata]XP_039143447.1 formin-like protein 16 [Dioscorea cayenensis subsp. rotundata]XP_039143448.1 formin-like protein 16 [Dioscorea cayenensis subsp. rotundata]XP_039143449.1 formin-like protein 16 [Dioscorea cayenensis subsp. rotundata]XP_039143450.1 formin-like protein 16 [Dioscorea cayenensis subsp. rotundata]XP_039143452.1 formin-like protein 16 [Dioscorea cayenensis subsp. rotundata]XP_039143453.1 formin-like protein 16 [Dioscore